MPELLPNAQLLDYKIDIVTITPQNHTIDAFCHLFNKAFMYVCNCVTTMNRIRQTLIIEFDLYLYM